MSYSLHHTHSTCVSKLQWVMCRLHNLKIPNWARLLLDRITYIYVTPYVTVRKLDCKLQFASSTKQLSISSLPIFHLFYTCNCATYFIICNSVLTKTSSCIPFGRQRISSFNFILRESQKNSTDK